MCVVRFECRRHYAPSYEGDAPKGASKYLLDASNGSDGSDEEYDDDSNELDESVPAQVKW